MFIQNHDLIRADRSPSEEGVCLYVKNSNNYLRNHVLGIILKQFVLKFSNLRVYPLLLEPFIGHPAPLLAPFRILNILVKLIDDGNKEFYLLGDLNSDMLDSLNNVTKHLNAIMELYQLSQTISSITHSRNDNLVVFIRRLYNSYARKISYIQSGAHIH